MTKKKFVLTSDLISVEPEEGSISSFSQAEPHQPKKNAGLKNTSDFDRFTLNIPLVLKKQLKLYCFNNNKQMSHVVIEALEIFLKDNKL